MSEAVKSFRMTFRFFAEIAPICPAYAWAACREKAAMNPVNFNAFIMKEPQPVHEISPHRRHLHFGTVA